MLYGWIECSTMRIVTVCEESNGGASVSIRQPLMSTVFVLYGPKGESKLGLSQITPGPRTASKNGYFGYFRRVPGRLPSDSTGAGTI